MIPLQEKTDAYAELERGVFTALETYSNVHRGSGHNSVVTTHLFERARNVVLDHLGLKKHKYTVIFCTPRRAQDLTMRLHPDSYRILSSRDAGLSLGCQSRRRPNEQTAGRASVSVRRWDVQTCLQGLGAVGQRSGQVRSRHACHHQYHHVCAGASSHAKIWRRYFPGF